MSLYLRTLLARTFLPEPSELVEHYPHPAEQRADGWVHGIGLAAALVGGLFLAASSWMQGRFGQATATSVYALCLIGMLSCSAIYNLTRPSPARRLLRRLDEAAIFFLIAGSCTPFTTQRFHGLEAAGLTAAIWALAIAGAGAKVFVNGLSDRTWCFIYLAFAWGGALVMTPLILSLSVGPLTLLAVGGAVYTLGVVFFLNPALRFRRAIWHGFVVAGAALHFAAVMLGVVLVSPT
ncbi:MAG: hemolysin III family protein [Proteobacteria bacterium]|nr:hemolysin III family protein [Pseudomonadota bacterium]